MMGDMPAMKITSPNDPALAELCRQLSERGADLDRQGKWPAEQLRLCGEYGVYEWFLDPAWAGQGWDEEQVARGYLALSAACLTTTFIVTQRTGACRRIAGCDSLTLKERLLPGLVSGERFATVGISHLTTSRRHLGKPVLTATATAGGFRLDGMSPWVTGGAAADVLVIAATLAEKGEPTEQQLLIAMPRERPGLRVADPLPLIGLSASATGPVYFDGAEISNDWVIAGPRPDVMSSGIGAGTGGHETSTLAIGVAQAALDYLADESARRSELREPLAAFQRENQSLRNDLLLIARGEGACSKESIRQRANSLVLRASQAALSAAKGSGYVVGHPAGRWCREALFFLVWSCPQPVANANLCELAGIED
jgi:alkylation response protein AidB-like acyl-CoA dehydrogenase